MVVVNHFLLMTPLLGEWNLGIPFAVLNSSARLSFYQPKRLKAVNPA